MTPAAITLRKLAVVAQWKDLAETSGLSPADLADCAITLRGEYEEEDAAVFIRRKASGR